MMFGIMCGSHGQDEIVGQENCTWNQEDIWNYYSTGDSWQWIPNLAEIVLINERISPDIIRKFIFPYNGDYITRLWSGSQVKGDLSRAYVLVLDNRDYYHGRAWKRRILFVCSMQGAGQEVSEMY